MKILDEVDGKFIIAISDRHHSTTLSFKYENKELTYLQNDPLTDFLKANEFQFRKLLNVKRPETYYKGFKLNFSIREGKDVEAFNDLYRILVLDKRNGRDDNYVITNSLRKIHELYVDGSFISEYKKGGIAIIIKSPEGNYQLKTFRSAENSSCLVELEAAIKGLELLKDIDEIRLVTDSQYVRKGLTEWIINWKLNDWHTANGEKVKNIEHWKRFEELSRDKYIEFKYVKAHSQQFENTMADLYAKDMARKM
jgi:ribonuclease HI